MDDFGSVGMTQRPVGVFNAAHERKDEDVAVRAPEPEGGSSAEHNDRNESQAASDRSEVLRAQVFKDANTRLQIKYNKDTGQFVYLSVDNKTGKVVRQFPPEEIAERVRFFREVAGITVDKTL